MFAKRLVIVRLWNNHTTPSQHAQNQNW